MYAAHLHPARKTLWIGSMSSSRGAAAFNTFASRHSDEPVSLSYQNFVTLEEVMQRLCCGRLDLATCGVLSPSRRIALSEFESADMEFHLLGKDAVFVAVGGGHPLADGRDSVRMEDLYPYVGVQYGTASDNPDHALLHAAGHEVHIKGEICVTGSNAFFDIIRGGSAFGLLMVSGEHFQRYSAYAEGLKILRLSDCSLEGEYYWVHPKGRELSDYAKEFLEILKELY